MRVRTHLVSMPWAPPDAPSIQIASLKAHLSRARADARTYSAFFSILHRHGGGALQDLYQSTAFYGEYIYQALYLRRFGPPGLRGRSAFGRLLKALREPPAAPPPRSRVEGLERATCAYLDEEVGPALVAGGLNVVGFTLNYEQVYASLYAAEHLRRRHPDRRFLFVYGGCSASFPNVYQLLVGLGVPGLVVVGEGERKLELLVRALEALPPAKAGQAADAVAGLDPGVVAIGQRVDLGVRDPARHATQVADLRELAPPDYDEYFAALRRACADRRTYEAFRAETSILVEGSRGCFGRCDFCAMNRTWSGFRRRTAEEVLRETLALTRRHHTVHVQFADNVCDTWAEEYARAVVQAGLHQRSFMELRAHHPEEFWTLLALAGVECVQVGVEALSSPFLKAMGKGATLVQNLAAHKVLCELDVKTGNNLMTHHPASTVADVRETWRILRHVPHLGPFRLTKFRLMAGSPLYESLSPSARAGLRPVRSFRLPEDAARYACEFSFELPEELHPGREVMRAWTAFKRRYERAAARHAATRPRLDVERVAPETLHVTDTRDGEVLVHALSGDVARIYDACHRGLTVEGAARATGLSPGRVEAALAGLVRSRLVLEVDASYLSLARRPRDELLRRLAAASDVLGGPAAPLDRAAS